MILDRTFEEIGRFNREYIPFPPFIEATEAIKANVKLFRQTGIARHTVVYGESNAGKSSLCSWVERQYPKYVVPDRDITPVLVVSVPSGATISSIASAILEKLGDPLASAGTISAKTSRVITLCHACGVEMILFDEAQHLADRGQVTTHYKAGDWLKSLIDQIGVPTVLVGLPDLELLLRVNEQLRRRVTRRFSLALGQNENISIHAECLQLFRSLAHRLPVPLTCGAYGWDEFGMRLFYATDGRVGYIKNLLMTALEFALETGMSEIDPPLLEQAFIKIDKGVIGKLNPFNAEFEFRRLDRGGEPFEKVEFKNLRKFG